MTPFYLLVREISLTFPMLWIGWYYRDHDRIFLVIFYDCFANMLVHKLLDI